MHNLTQIAIEVSVDSIPAATKGLWESREPQLCSRDRIGFLFGEGEVLGNVIWTNDPHYLPHYWAAASGVGLSQKRPPTLHLPSLSLYFFLTLLLPSWLSVIHRREEPGEYRDAHFNLESMNKQWGFPCAAEISPGDIHSIGDAHAHMRSSRATL